MHKPPRKVQLGSTGTEVECDREGRYAMRATEPLAAYPERLTERLAHWAERAPERTFLAKRQRGGPFERLNYGEAFARMLPLAAALLARDLSAARPLAILSENDLEHALIALAALHVGVPFVPISPAYSLLSRDYGRLREALGTLAPGLVYVSDGSRYARAVAAALPSDTEVAVGENGAALERPYTPWSELARGCSTARASSSVERAHRAIGRDTLAKLLLTSGSTGTPKAVMQTMGMLCSNQQMLLQRLPFLGEEPPVIVDWLPWHHTFGGNHNLGLVLYNGGTLYIDEGRPTPDGFAESVRNLREIAPTVYFNVPRGFDELARALARDAALARTFFSRLSLMFYAAASLSPRTWDALQELALNAVGERILMVTGIGMTETSPFALSAHWDTGKAGIVGIPAPGLELRLAPVGAKLEARYKGPNVTPGFFKSPELDRTCFDEDGFYKSGDALEFVDRARPELGLAFAGRLGEDFKLDTGTWVSVGPLRARALLEGAPYVQDVVPTAPDRSELGLLIIPHVECCRELCPELARTSAAGDVLAHPNTRAFFQELLERLARDATGSATRVERALLITEPLSLDAGEVTDKGSVVQATVRRTRAALVDRLYGDHVDVLRLRR